MPAYPDCSGKKAAKLITWKKRPLNTCYSSSSSRSNNSLAVAAAAAANFSKTVDLIKAPSEI